MKMIRCSFPITALKIATFFKSHPSNNYSTEKSEWKSESVEPVWERPVETWMNEAQARPRTCFFPAIWIGNWLHKPVAHRALLSHTHTSSQSSPLFMRCSWITPKMDNNWKVGKQNKRKTLLLSWDITELKWLKTCSNNKKTERKKEEKKRNIDWLMKMKSLWTESISLTDGFVPGIPHLKLNLGNRFWIFTQN